ncbi:MAG: ParA family protein [Clostridia bacterium]|nr:ParA family protein [Clostridia bacterium]MBO5439609.1 ParA family protein [Clostridia bacterium]
MVHIISFANQKGGVGKTTSAVNCAASLGALGKKTLLIDLDPQGSSTSSVGVAKNSVKFSSYDVLTLNCKPSKAIIETEFKNLYIMPSNMALAAAELELATQEKREYFLKGALEELEKSSDFDYVIIDCPPSLGIITINALAASHGLVVPIQCEYFALEGLSQLMMTFKSVRQRYNPRLNITGILITMYNARYKLSAQVLEELNKYYSYQLFDTKISRVISLSEAPSFGEPIRYYSRYSKGSLEYESVAKEIITRVEGY